ncbi:hypothetical protein AAE02nite_12650 [Adhaeribacter aerolatus]|uniref:Uncharacterized protein n=1 Tax=Adhaeribacter aerolatus TaxID=670289 RepID=A0A512AV52_9BACT|nr:hypothetical protein [Adhaeribacter aerolatus]GEO03601.1 hypothetical protein AAE02nite_12650 [Adhaeribacter aerolatus]
MSDLTYIKTEEGWLYLRAILELADRKEVGWALSNTMALQSNQCGGLADGHLQQAGKLN